jgi:O-antigen/teichoic acid export membrane protein
MLQTLKRLAKIVMGYGAVQWAGPLLSFVFTPIITRLLSPSDYGIADYVLTIGSAAGTLSLFALPQALTAHFNDRADEGWRRQLTGSALALAWSIGIPVGLALVVFAPAVAQQAFGNQGQTVLFQLAGATMVFGVCAGILTAAAQAALRVRWGMAFSLASVLATVGGNVLFIIVFRWGSMGLVLASMAPGIVVSLVGLRLMAGALARPTLQALRLLARSGATLLPTVLSSWSLMVVSRFFLVQYVTTEALGHYAIANKVAGLAYVALSPVYSAWTSLALSMQHDPDARRRYAVMSRYLLAVALCVCLALGLFATEILLVLTRPAYLPAAPYVGFLAYIQVFSAFGTVLYTSALAAKQLGAVSWTVVAGALVSVVLNYLLVPDYGLWGATAATVVGYAVPQLLLYPIVQKRYPVNYPTGRLVAAMAVETVLLLLGMLVPAVAFPVRVAAKACLLLALPLCYLPLGILSREELSQATAFATRRLKQLRQG